MNLLILATCCFTIYLGALAKETDGDSGTRADWTVAANVKNKRLAEVEPPAKDTQKRQWTFGGNANHNPGGGTNFGINLGRTWDHGGGQWTVGGNVNRNPNGGTDFGVDLGKIWDHGGGSNTKLFGKYNHNTMSGNSWGVGISHTFGKRLAELESTVKDMHKRQWTVGGNVNRNPNGGKDFGVDLGKIWDHGGGSNTKLFGKYNHNTMSGNSWGVGISHTFGKRLADLESKVKDVHKRQWTFGGNANHNPGGGTDFGINLGRTWDHGGGSNTKLFGKYNHNTMSGNSWGVGISHTFGKRLAEVAPAVRDLQRRQWTVDGKFKHNQGGTINVGNTWDNGHFSGTLNHDPKTGTGWGIDFSHTFGKRLAELEAAVKHLQQQ